MSSQLEMIHIATSSMPPEADHLMALFVLSEEANALLDPESSSRPLPIFRFRRVVCHNPRYQDIRHL